MNYKSLTTEEKRKFNILSKGVKAQIKTLDNVEVEAYAAHFYHYRQLHKKYLKEGIYNEFWEIFRALKEGRLQNTLEHKEIGEYGLYLITKLHPWEELHELDLIETVISFRNLTTYLKEEILGEKSKKKC